MSKPTQFVDFYELLGVAPTAAASEIKTAIRNQRKDWTRRQNHPDAELRTKAEKTVSVISQAEPLLLDPERRAAYDAERVAHTAAADKAARQAEEAARAAQKPVGRDWIGIARHYLDDGKAFEANYAAREATSANSEDAEAWFVRARSSLGLKKRDDAKFEASEAVRLNPSKPMNHALLGDIYSETGNSGAALAEYNEAARLDPKQPAFQVAAASLLGRTGRRSEAIVVLERIVANFPQVEHFQEQYATLLLDDAVDRWSTDLRGGKVITNLAQVEATRTVLARVLGLAAPGPELQARISKILQLCSDATATKWYPSGHGRWYLGGFVGSMILMTAFFNQGGASIGAGVVFLLVAIGVATIFIRRHHLPQWRVNQKVYPPAVTRSGLQ